MDDNAFRNLLDRLGYSRQGYARVRKGVKKRIGRHMQELGCHTMEDYLHALKNPRTLKDVERLMSVSISRFFRDRYLWHALEEDILPCITEKHTETINIWSAGCALGQEAYSLSILWDILRTRFSPLPELHILATDSNDEYLRKAMEGIYSESSMKGLSETIKSAYFHLPADTSNYHIVDRLKKNIRWELHDLTAQPPHAEAYTIIFLRNSLFTYYHEDRRTPVFLTILESLDEGGFFIIGRREKLPVKLRTLLPFKDCPYIFQKI